MCSKQGSTPCSYSAQGDIVCYSKEPNLTPSFAMQGSSAFFQGVVYNTSTLLNNTDLQTYEKTTGAPAAPAKQADHTLYEWATVGRKQNT